MDDEISPRATLTTSNSNATRDSLSKLSFPLTAPSLGRDDKGGWMRDDREAWRDLRDPSTALGMTRKGGRDDKGDSPFRKGTKGNVLSFGANERTKESIHLPQGPSLYGGDATDNLGKPQILRLH